MKFGIMSSQTQLLIPNNIKSNQLESDLFNNSYISLLNKIIDSGFKHIELSGDLFLLLPHYFSNESISDLRSLKSESGLSFTVHLPLWSVELSTPLDTIRNGSVNALINHINLMRVLEPEIYVLHATGALAAEFYRMKLPEIVKIYLLKVFKENAKSSIEKILLETGIENRKLAIETIEFPLELTLQIANELDLSICFDTGHILAGFSGKFEFFDAYAQCSSRIAEIHLHDCPIQESSIGYGQDHKPLGKGNLDVRKFIDSMTANQFNGPIIFELGVDEAKESIRLIQELKPNLPVEL